MQCQWAGSYSQCRGCHQMACHIPTEIRSSEFQLSPNVRPLCGRVQFPNMTKVFQESSWLSHSVNPCRPAWQKMAQSQCPFNGAIQPVDTEEAGRSTTSIMEWWLTMDKISYKSNYQFNGCVLQKTFTIKRQWLSKKQWPTTSITMLFIQ